MFYIFFTTNARVDFCSKLPEKRSCDSAFTDVTHTIAAMHVHQVVTAPRSPWQNAYVERLIGSMRANASTT